jgi:hypothetical protein
VADQQVKRPSQTASLVSFDEEALFP